METTTHTHTTNFTAQTMSHMYAVATNGNMYTIAGRSYGITTDTGHAIGLKDNGGPSVWTTKRTAAEMVDYMQFFATYETFTLFDDLDEMAAYAKAIKAAA